MIWRIGSTALLVVLLATMSGCSENRRFPVRGRLIYEDTGLPIKELAGCTVTFTSEEAGKSARGIISRDGTFQLTSLTPNDGLAPGIYRVFITQPRSQPERGVFYDPIVDPVYEDPSASGLTYEVKELSNSVTLTLRRAP